MNLFRIQQKTQVPDGIGGFSETWDDMPEVSGYLDMLTGTDLNSVQNAFIEQSTHVLIIPEYTEWITDQMRIVDMDGRTIDKVLATRHDPDAPEGTDEVVAP